MAALDWTVLVAYFAVMVGIGIWARRRIRHSGDYFAAGGRMPWWLAGISHHMSGYSAAVFVGFAAIAYQYGFTLYIWWAVGIAIALLVGAALFAPRWPRLRQRFGIASPMEYLRLRYNLPTQQVLAWSGTLLKVFDVGAKWTAIAILLNVFTGLPLLAGIALTGGVTLVYCTVGGLWADALTEFGQFVIQLIAGITLFVIVLGKLGGVSGLWTMWERLPAEHAKPFAGPYTLIFVLAYLLIDSLSYNGGTWNLAQRFMATSSGASGRRSALLSAGLYLVWGAVLFYPMWAAPLLYPHLADPTQSYAIVSERLLPTGLLGLLVAGLMSHTMAMTSSDANAISAVVTRDIIPAVWRKARDFTASRELVIARTVTVVFMVLTMVLAWQADRFGGVIGLIILWFGALIGPISIPMLLGMLPAFRRSGPVAAIVSWLGGLVAFGVVKYGVAGGDAAVVATPVVTSLVLYVVIGLLRSERSVEADAVVDALSDDEGRVEPTRAPGAVEIG